MHFEKKIDPLLSKAELRFPPIIVRVNKFTEESADAFSEAMSAAQNTGQPVIPVVIDSYGGQVYSLLAMISEIKNSSVPVATIVEGKAMSCGAVLFTFGAPGYRFMAPDATIMIHDVSSGGRGKIEELKADVAEASRLDGKIYTMMAQNCGKKDDYFKKIVQKKGHADWFLDAEECKKHHICNHIRIPKLVASATVEISFE